MNAQAQALARAFRHDPAVCYLLPDPNRRERAMRFAFSCYLRYGERFGKVDVSASGAAVWLPARYARLGIFGLVCAGFAATPLTLGMPALRRMIHFGEVITRLRDRVMSGPHWYLFILGADPADTGEGSRGWKEPTVRGCPATWRPPHPARCPFTPGTGFGSWLKVRCPVARICGRYCVLHRLSHRIRLYPKLGNLPDVLGKQ